MPYVFREGNLAQLGGHPAVASLGVLVGRYANLDSFPRDTIITGTIHATKSLSIEIKAASYTFNY
jgi:hypothetical protein